MSVCVCVRERTQIDFHEKGIKRKRKKIVRVSLSNWFGVCWGSSRTLNVWMYKPLDVCCHFIFLLGLGYFFPNMYLVVNLFIHLNLNHWTIFRPNCSSRIYLFLCHTSPSPPTITKSTLRKTKIYSHRVCQAFVL